MWISLQYDKYEQVAYLYKTFVLAYFLSVVANIMMIEVDVWARLIGATVGVAESAETII